MLGVRGGSEVTSSMKSDLIVRRVLPICLNGETGTKVPSKGNTVSGTEEFKEKRRGVVKDHRSNIIFQGTWEMLCRSSVDRRYKIAFTYEPGPQIVISVVPTNFRKL